MDLYTDYTEMQLTTEQSEIINTEWWQWFIVH